MLERLIWETSHEEIERERVIEWYEIVREKVITKNLRKVKKYTIKNKLDLENSITECTCRLILIFQEIKKKL